MIDQEKSDCCNTDVSFIIITVMLIAKYFIQVIVVVIYQKFYLQKL